jgi:N-acetylmuramoyl-L-alanine amidase
LAENGFGVWKDDILETYSLDFNPEQGLNHRYDTKNLPAAIKAFKFHFIQTSRFNPINTIYSIYKKQ